MMSYLKKIIRKWRSALLVFLTHHMALPVLKYIRKEEKFPYTIDDLMNFRDGILGKELAVFLREKKLQLLPFYARHDMKHILLGYDTTDEGEGCLQCFMLGNGHVSFPVIATVLYCYTTMPEYWPQFRKAYQRGKASAPIAGWDWFSVVAEDTEALRKRIGLGVHG